MLYKTPNWGDIQHDAVYIIVRRLSSKIGCTEKINKARDIIYEQNVVPISYKNA